VEPVRPPSVSLDDVVVTCVAHATFLIQMAEANLLINPVCAERASPVSARPA